MRSYRGLILNFVLVLGMLVYGFGCGIDGNTAEGNALPTVDKVLEVSQTAAEAVSTGAAAASPFLPQAGPVAVIAGVVAAFLAAAREAIKRKRTEKELELAKLQNKSPPKKGKTQ